MMNTFRWLRNSLLKNYSYHFYVVVCSEYRVKLLLRWFSHDTLCSLTSMKYLEGCSAGLS